jgi:hypothetical protein
MGMLFFPSNLAWGQAFVNGTIGGTVTDSSGAVIPDVPLTLTNIDTGAKVTLQTDRSGSYHFSGVAPGQYRIDAERAGFAHFTREPIVVLVNGDVHIDITLQVGAATQTVRVTAETPLLQAESSSLGQVIETRTVNELPLNGRNPLALASLSPGIVLYNGAGATVVTQNPFYQGNFNINGGMSGSSAAFWDGAPLNSAGYINELALLPSQDAVQEFKVQTDNLPPQYDRYGGGIVSFSTKSGTNRVHGEAYEFLRNKALNSNNYFSNAYGVPLTPFTQNQFGGTFGGPLYLPGLYNGKDKTFFFASFDGFRLREGLPLVFTVPTEAMRSGDFSGYVDANGNQIPIYDPTTTCGVSGNPACATDAQGNPIYTRQQFPGNIIPPGRLDHAAQVLSSLWGPPNTTGLQNGFVNNWAGAASEGGDLNEFSIRVDHNVSDKQRIFSRYTLNKYDNLAIDPFGTHAYPLFTGTPENTKTQQAAFDESYSFAPTKILDVEIAVLREWYDRRPQSLGYDLGQLGPGWAPLNNEVSFRTLPDLCVAGVNDFCSGETGSTITDESTDIELLPNFTMIKGRHTIKIGADLRLNRFNYAQDNQPTGVYSFGYDMTQQGPAIAHGGLGVASFMLGAADSGDITAVNFIGTQQIYRAVYAEDDIHPTHKLTLNLGLRYSQDGPFSERYNRISTFVGSFPNPLVANTSLPENGTLCLVDTACRPSRNGFNMDKSMFSPRVGFAYLVTPDTVIRGGYGISWLPNSIGYIGTNPAIDAVNWFDNYQATSLNGGLTPNTYFSNPFPNGIHRAPGRDPAYAIETLGGGLWNTEIPNQPNPYAQQWNIDLQKNFKGGLFVDAAYVGTKGTHLPEMFTPLSMLPNQEESLGNALLAQVPNPYYGLIQTGGLSGPTFSYEHGITPYPQYSSVSVETFQGNSIYNAFQLKVQKRFSSGQTILLGYSADKFITNAEGFPGGNSYGGIQNWFNMKGERALCSFDDAQRLVVSYVLDLPTGHGRKFLSGASGLANKLVSGWAMEGVTTLDRGFPIYIGDAANTTFSNGGGQRPDYNPLGPGCSKNAALHGSATSRLGEWFNTACFSQPPAFTFGNVPRVDPTLREDGIANFDWAAIKNTGWGLDDRFHLQFRAEFFNLFNHPQFGYPGMTYGAGGFGVVSSQNNTPRLIQFGLKFLF